MCVCVCVCDISDFLLLLPPRRRWGRQPSGRLWSQHRTDCPPPADTRRDTISSFIQDMWHHPHCSVLIQEIWSWFRPQSNLIVTSQWVQLHQNTQTRTNCTMWVTKSLEFCSDRSRFPSCEVVLLTLVRSWTPKITCLSFYHSECLHKTWTTVSCIWVTRRAKEPDHVRQQNMCHQYASCHQPNVCYHRQLMNQSFLWLFKLLWTFPVGKMPHERTMRLDYCCLTGSWYFRCLDRKKLMKWVFLLDPKHSQ